MFLQKLELKNFRNFENEVIELNKGINLFYGFNGSGKTNILEAISILSGIKSFKGSKDNDMVKWNSDYYYCSGIFDDNKFEAAFRMSGKGRDKKLKINGTYIKSIIEYFGKILTVVFSPDDINLIDGGPDNRRRFFDNILSKTDKDYFNNLIIYKKILKYRNSILRSGKDILSVKKDLSVWDDKFAAAGFSLHRKRKIFSVLFNNRFSSIAADLDGNDDLTVFYSSDAEYEDENDYLMKNNKLFEKDFRYGYTTSGPHRDDFIIKGFGGKLFVSFASQGQKRSAAVSLKICEKEIIEEIRREKAILLVDDIFSELDDKRKKSLRDIMKNGNQTIFTMADRNNKKYFSDASVFNIYEGKVSVEV